MIKVLHCDIVISEFELQSRYNGYFRTNTFENGLTHLEHWFNSTTFFTSTNLALVLNNPSKLICLEYKEINPNLK